MIDSIIEKINEWIDRNIGRMTEKKYKHITTEMVEQMTIEVDSEEEELIKEVFEYNSRNDQIGLIAMRLKNMRSLCLRLNAIVCIGELLIVAAQGNAWINNVVSWIVLAIYAFIVIWCVLSTDMKLFRNVIASSVLLLINFSFIVIVLMNFGFYYVYERVEKPIRNDIAYPLCSNINMWVIYPSGTKKLVAGRDMR